MSDPPSDSNRSRQVYRTLPPASKLILATIVDEDGVAKRQTILERTGLGRATVDRSLRRLQSTGFLSRQAGGSDAREVLFTVRDDSPSFW